MRNTIIISLPAPLKKALDRATLEAGASRSDLVRKSLEQYLFLRRFRSLRQRMSPKAAERGIFTDQDVFDRVS